MNEYLALGMLKYRLRGASMELLMFNEDVKNLLEQLSPAEASTFLDKALLNIGTARDALYEALADVDRAQWTVRP